jgi:hypothetical protein
MNNLILLILLKKDFSRHHCRDDTFSTNVNIDSTFSKYQKFIVIKSEENEKPLKS